MSQFKKWFFLRFQREPDLDNENDALIYEAYEAGVEGLPIEPVTFKDSILTLLYGCLIIYMFYLFVGLVGCAILEYIITPLTYPNPAPQFLKLLETFWLWSVYPFRIVYESMICIR